MPLIATCLVVLTLVLVQVDPIVEQPGLLAQEEGDIDESYDDYGQDIDEVVEYDNATITKDPMLDSLLAGITWLGHASFLISDSIKIYIDPFNLSGDVPKADLVLITHDHYDHFSPVDLNKILKSTTSVVSIKQVIDKLKNDLKHLYVVEPGDTLEVAGITIATVPAYNLDKKFHPRSKNYVGFVIHTSRVTIYHAGDTDFIPEMRDIQTDIALLPVGGKFTMDARGAAKAAELIRPKVAIPMHYGSIVGSLADAELFAALCSTKSKVRVRILEAPVKEISPEEREGRH